MEQKFKLEQFVFGKCKRCQTGDAIYGGLQICQTCFDQWNTLSAHYPNMPMEKYLIRKVAVDKFFNNEQIENIFKEVKK